MKKIYSILLLCFLSLSGYAQITTTFYANGLAGTFITGRATSTGTRTDGNITCNGTGTITRGYAVFDLTTIPVGSTVISVDLGVNIAGFAGTPGVCSTNVFNGDLSLVTVGATLYSNMAVPPSVNVSTAPYGAAIGNIVIPTTAAAESAVAAGAGGKISYVFTNTGSGSYNISGETASPVTIGTHCPYITVTYCPPPTGITATASPLLLCEGDNLTLTGTATGATSYSWSGPGGYTAAVLNPAAFATTLASAGVYTLTATATCGAATASYQAVTSTVSINPLPAAITGATAVCVASATTLTGDGTMPGNWTSSNPAVATIGLTTGTVIGVAAGTVTMTYTVATGCFVTHNMTVNDVPGPISGPTEVCVGSTITLTNTVSGGDWTSSATGTATVGLGSGIVTGVAAGVATISYIPAGCPFAVYDVTVNPLPANILGPNNVCAGSTVTETDADPGGTWSSSNITRAIINTSGVVTGVAAGSLNIIYTLPVTGCQFIKPFTVNALPAAIVIPSNVCEAGTITLTDPTPGGNFSGGAPNASISLGGVVTGINAGTAVATYTIVATSCFITGNLIIDPAPAAITGVTNLCENTTTTLSNADPGGVWSSVSTANATVGSSSGIVTAILAPGTNILYTLPSGCSISAPLTIYPAPVSVITPAGPTTFCTGLDVVLAATTGVGLTYQWNVGGVAIAGETNSFYTANTTGGYTVDITNSFGCSTTSAVEPVTAGITAVVDHTTPLNFCIGSSILLTANTGGVVGAIAYQWQKDGIDIPGEVASTYSATANGAYGVVVTISGGSGICSVTSTAVNVLVNPLPVPPISYTGTVLATAGTYAGYQWFLNTVAIPGANSPTYYPTLNGSYRVRVNDGIGCMGFSGAFSITGVGVEEVNKVQVSVYPNPAKDVLHIESAVAVKAVITSMEGRVQLSRENARDLDISGLANGLYLVMLYDANGERLMVQKLVKE